MELNAAVLGLLLSIFVALLGILKGVWAAASAFGEWKGSVDEKLNDHERRLDGHADRLEDHHRRITDVE